MKKVLAGVLAVMMTFSGGVLPDSQFWKGAGVIRAAAETWSSAKSLTSDMTVSGSVETNSDIKLNGCTLTVNGDLYMTAGMLDIGTGKLIVNGNLYIGKEITSSNACIKMQNSSASITISGDLVWNVSSSATNTSGTITAGTINVAGNVYDYISSTTNRNSFCMTGSSVLNLNGSGTQTIKGSYNGTLERLTVTGNRTVDMEGYYYSTTALSSDLNIVTRNGLNITRMVMGGKTVNITGNVTQFESDIELGGGTLNINGNFTASGGTTRLGGGKLNVSGDYRIGKINSKGVLEAADAGLDMSYSTDTVTVGGSFIIKNWAGSSTNSTKMTAGKMYVGGDFDSNSNKITFGSGNTVYMNGTGYQTVTLNNSKKIYNLVLLQDMDKYNSDIADYAVKLVTNQPDISTGTVTLSTSTYTYDGTAKQPTVTVKVNGTTLTKDTDYTVTYSNNTNKGTASVTVRGKGKYTGSVTKNFTINAKDASSLTMTLSATSYTYDGTAKKPTVTVKDGSKTLVSGTDYTVSYSNNTNAGTATATITCKGNYTGTKSANFTITKTTATSLSSCTITLGTTSYTYDGTAKQPSVTIKNGSATLTKGTDYTVSYSNNTKAGTATVTIKGAGSYTGTVTKYFTINAKDASGVTITLSAANYTYDGSAKKPTVTVKDGSKTLVSGTDYSVSYSNNTNVGTATATITFKGNYTGTKYANFTISSASAKQISDCTITLSTTSYTYDGTAKQPGVTVKNGSTLLYKGTDYTVSYSNNTNAGTATVTITGAGKYAGTVNKTFTISAKSASSLTMTLSATSYTYDGTAKKPTVTVKDGSKTLVSGTDYTVSYSNNTNVGTATATITCKGNYTGTKSANFTISSSSAKQIGDCTITLSTTSYTYDGTAKQPSVTVKNGSTLLYKGTDYTVSYSNNTNAGTATVTITGAGKYAGTVNKTFTISAKSASSLTVTVSPTSYTYDGSAKQPTVTVKDGSKTLVNGTDYTVSYSNNTNAGTATATITCKGNYTGTKSANFTISSASATQISTCTITLDTTSYTYDGTAKQPGVTVKNGSTLLTKGTDYTVLYSNNTNAGTATVTITGAGKYAGTVNKTFTISAKSASSLTMTLSAASYTYDGSAKKPTVTVKDGSKTLVSGTDYTVSYSNNTNVGTATATITCKGNYTGTKSANFTISNPVATQISTCTITLGTNSYIYDGTAKQPSVTVKNGSTLLTKGTDYAVSYSNNTNAGTATVTITGAGKYAGTATKTFTIDAKSASSLTMTLSATSYTYDGSAKQPSVTVKDGSKTLVSGTDYTVSYSNNTNVGTATATITCKGNYTGTKSASFAISSPVATQISTCTITLGTTSYTYDGSEKKPGVTVKNGSAALVNGTDYVVSYSNNVNAGTATVTISGAGKYTGTASRTFTINAKSAGSLTMTLSATSYTYDGKTKTPSVTVTDGAVTLVNGVDYTVSYSNNTNVGTATAKITCMGNYTGTKSANFTISKAAPVQISNCTVALGTVNYIYDGTAKQPAVTVKNGSELLVSGTDYTVSYSNNTKAGKATATITGKGGYTGTVTKEFTIDPRNISELNVVVDPTSYTYDGKEKTPAVTVKDGSVTLKKDTDYTVSYINNTQVGTATVTVSGKGNYSGSKSYNFTISEAAATPITKCTASLSNSSYTYDGAAKQPSVTVKNGTATLVKGTDYIVSYTNNINVGTASVNIMGMGKYSGTITKTFTINAKSVSSLSAVVSPAGYTYDGTAKKPDVTVSDGTRTLTVGRDYTVTYSNNVNAGTAGVTIKGTGNYTGSLNKSFRISPKSVSELDITLSATDYTFDGSAKQPAVTVYDGSKKLVSGTDFTVSYSNNTKIGTAAVTVTGKGNYTGSKAAYFTISKAGAVNIATCKASLDADSFVYDGMAKTPAITVKNGSKTLRSGVDYTYVYDNNVNAGTGSVIVTGIGDYSGTGTLRFTISPATIENVSVDVLTPNYIYDGTEKKPGVTVTEGMKTLVEGVDYILTYGNNIEAGIGHVYVNGIGNYTDIKDADFAITAKDANSNNISECSIVLTSDSVEYTGEAVTPDVIIRDGVQLLTRDVDYTVDYSANVNTGTAKVVITGMGAYTGICEGSFRITAKSSQDLDISMTPDSFEYDGTAKKPKITVKDGGRTLTEKADYTVDIADNMIAGDAVVTVNFTGNYSGSEKRSFKIAASDIKKASVKLEKYYYDANGSERKPSVTVVKDGRTLVENRDYKVVYSSNVNSGTAYVTINGQGNYYGTVTERFAIGSASGKSIAGFRISMDTSSFVYDGTAKKPNITLTDGSVTLNEGQYFEAVCVNNVNAGKATIIAVGKNGYKDTVSAEFEIKPKQINAAQAVLSADSYEYDGCAKTPAVTVACDGAKLAEGRDFTVKYTNNTAAGTAAVTITGAGNYTGTIEKTFTINGRNAAALGLELEKNEYVYGGKEIRPKLKVTDGSKVLTAGTDYDVTYENNNEVGAARVVVTGKGNYSGTTGTSFSIAGTHTQNVMKGDVNKDGVVNVTDLSKVAAHIKSKKSLTGDQLLAADVNGDGVVNITDLSRIAGHIKGKKQIQ